MTVNKHGSFYLRNGWGTKIIQAVEKDEMIFFDQEFYWQDIEPEVALVRGLWQLMWSDGSRYFEITKIWLEELKERYGLTDRWESLLRIARDDTHEYVFNPNNTQAISNGIEEALVYIKRNSNRITEWGND